MPMNPAGDGGGAPHQHPDQSGQGDSIEQPPMEEGSTDGQSAGSGIEQQFGEQLGANYNNNGNGYGSEYSNGANGHGVENGVNGHGAEGIDQNGAGLDLQATVAGPDVSKVLPFSVGEASPLSPFSLSPSDAVGGLHSLALHERKLEEAIRMSSIVKEEQAQARRIPVSLPISLFKMWEVLGEGHGCMYPAHRQRVATRYGMAVLANLPELAKLREARDRIHTSTKFGAFLTYPDFGWSVRHPLLTATKVVGISLSDRTMSEIDDVREVLGLTEPSVVLVSILLATANSTDSAPELIEACGAEMTALTEWLTGIHTMWERALDWATSSNWSNGTGWKRDNDARQWVSERDAAVISGKGARTISLWVKLGLVQTQKSGATVMIDRASLEKAMRDKRDGRI